MIHPDSILKYHEAFPEDACGYAVPSSLVAIDSHVDQRTFISPIDEDDETFIDRIERSKEAGRNLFYEEWEEEEMEEGVWH